MVAYQRSTGGGGRASQLPTVAIIIPCYNEADYIRQCLDSLLSTSYDLRLIEIVVVDGMSHDGTRTILSQYTRRYPNLRVLDNQKRIKPVALNLGITNTDSQIVMRADAHSVYDTEYIPTLINALLVYQVENAGGLRRTAVSTRLLAKAIGEAISHPFATGNARWRGSPKEVMSVDTVFGGCYPRRVFDRLGLFNERLIRTQDREFNYRLRRAGGQILLVPSASCTYFPRTEIGHYIRWIWQGAYWLCYARRFTATPLISVRNLVPALFIVWHFIVLGAAAWSASLGLVTTLPIALYWLVVATVSTGIAIKHRLPSLAPMMALVFGVTHYAYGVGEICGFLHATLRGRSEGGGP